MEVFLHHILSLHNISMKSDPDIMQNTCVAPPTQGTWRSNDYVSAFRLVDVVLFYGVGR